ncbi:MAG: tyrosine-protein kinase family protein [Terriglobales bacterium]
MATLETMPTLMPAALEATQLELTAHLQPPDPPPPGLIAQAHPQAVGAEQFRRLTVSLQHLRRRRPLRRLLVTSAAPGEGKSLSAANLALTLARPGTGRVLLLEGDLHRPVLPARLGFSCTYGLADWLEGRRGLRDCLLRWPGLPLWLLPAARARALPLELLQATSPDSILQTLDPLFDWIVVDSPPLLPMADAAHWAAAADGVLLVVRAGHTRRSDLRRATSQIERERWLGVILNDCSSREHYYYAQYYSGKECD